MAADPHPRPRTAGLPQDGNPRPRAEHAQCEHRSPHAAEAVAQACVRRAEAASAGRPAFRHRGAPADGGPPPRPATRHATRSRHSPRAWDGSAGDRAGRRGHVAVHASNHRHAGTISMERPSRSTFADSSRVTTVPRSQSSSPMASASAPSFAARPPYRDAPRRRRGPRSSRLAEGLPRQGERVAVSAPPRWFRPLGA